MTPTILIVDDERVIVDAFCIILNQSGYSAHGAFTGDEAVVRARELRPDAIVMGIVMPGINGFEAAERILEFQPLCPILFMSGSVTAFPEKFEHLRNRGFKLLPKPVHPQTLLENLAQILSRPKHD